MTHHREREGTEIASHNNNKILVLSNLIYRSQSEGTKITVYLILLEMLERV